MAKFENPAIVLGGGDTTGLGAVRSLGRAGVGVYYVDDEESIAVHSKFCRNYYISPKVGRSKEELRNILLRIQPKIGDTPVLFAASDLYALYISDLLDDLTGFHIPAPRRRIIEILINKKRFYQSLWKERIPTPVTYFPDDLENAMRIGKQVSYPVFLKPCFSHLFRRQFGGGRKGFLANSQAELVKYCELLIKTGIDVMIQEVILGPPTNGVFVDGYLDADSNPKVLFARRRLRMWPLDFGNSTLCVSIPISHVASLKEPLFRYLKSINYCGIFSAEFKKDERDGSLKLVEINTRTSAWFNTLSARCGANIMLVAYLDAIGRDLEYREDYKAGVRVMFTKDDVRASMAMFMNRDLSIGKWISSLVGDTEFTPFARDDALPAVKDLSKMVRSFARL